MQMVIPSRYATLNLTDVSGFRKLATGVPVRLPRDWMYPPFGYLRLGLFDLGNGDASGFYWPIGREAEEPLVCDMQHDSWYIDPVASSLEALVPIRVQQGSYEKNDDFQKLASGLQVDIPPPAEEPYDPLNAPSEIAWRSPRLLIEQSKALIEKLDLPEAEKRLRRSLELLPEYTDARFLLAKLLRRQRRLDEAVLQMIETCCNSVVFGRGHRECLQWLQRLPDSSEAAHSRDPFWVHRHELTFSDARTLPPSDLALLERLVAAFLDLGLGERAVRLRVTIGERFGSPLPAISEQNGYSESMHFERAEAEMRRAGLTLRADAVSRSLA